MGRLELTAPDSWGAFAGSTLYGGIVNGYNNNVLGAPQGLPTMSSYVGTTIATANKHLRFGASFDELNVDTSANDTGIHYNGEAWTVAGYASWQCCEKCTLHARLEYAEASADSPAFIAGTIGHPKVLAATATIQYDLWKNVLSRLEFRWDHSLQDMQVFGGDVGTGGAPNADNAYLLALNLIYKF
jgi:hypothetical protein